jgi:hypothetical protein
MGTNFSKSPRAVTLELLYAERDAEASGKNEKERRTKVEREEAS